MFCSALARGPGKRELGLVEKGDGMKQHVLTRLLPAFFVAGLVMCSPVWGAWAGEDIVAAGSYIIQSPLPVALSGVGAHIAGCTLIDAAAGDITLSTQGVTTIQPGVVNTLVLRPNGHNITFIFNDNTTWQSLANAELLIVLDYDSGLPGFPQATGQVIFQYAGGTETVFTGYQAFPSGQQRMVFLVPVAANRPYTGPVGPRLKFQLLPNIAGDDAKVTFTTYAVLTSGMDMDLGAVSSYPDPSEAYVELNSTNAVANNGRLRVQVQPYGAINVQAYQYTAAQSPNSLKIPVVPSAIDFSSLALPLTVLNTAYVRAGIVCRNDYVGVQSNHWSGTLLYNTNSAFEPLAYPTPVSPGAPGLRANPWHILGNLVYIQYGFVVGANGALIIDDDAYLLFMVGVKNKAIEPNVDPTVLHELEINGFAPLPRQVAKDFNPASCIFDGWGTALDSCFNNPGYFTCYDSAAGAQYYPRWLFYGRSKMYFGSAVNENNIVADPATFLVDPKLQWKREFGEGTNACTIVGMTDCLGLLKPNQYSDAIEILSVKTENTGGLVLIEDTAGPTIFRKKVFTPIPSTGVYEQYGTACMVINGRLNLHDMNLEHTDIIHKVFEKNLLGQSEPCYVGGESFRLYQTSYPYPDPAKPFWVVYRPTIALYNSFVRLRESAASAGVDWRTTNGTGLDDNTSALIFGYNGTIVDSGTGRSLILGTRGSGCFAVDKNTVIDPDSHCDILQELSAAAAPGTLSLQLQTAPNTSAINPNIPVGADITGQESVQDFYLANKSNNSIGTNNTDSSPKGQGKDPRSGLLFTPSLWSELLIQSNFFALETQGGTTRTPKDGVVRGQGAIFVDNFGRFVASPTARPFINCMIGVGPYDDVGVTLQAYQVRFGDEVGLTRSSLNLADTPTIVSGSSVYPDYTFDCKYAVWDPNYVPYPLPLTPTAAIPPFTSANMFNVPTISGELNQLQVANARVGAPPTLLVSALAGPGRVREFVFLQGQEAGVAPVGLIVLEDDANIGCGSARRNPDSVYAQDVWGVNGKTWVPNGNAQVNMNDDAIINNYCHIIPGPNFGLTETHTLLFTTEVPREIRIKTGGFLDLRAFTKESQRIVFDNVTIVVEPGGRIAFCTDMAPYGTHVVFEGIGSIRAEPYFDAGRPLGTEVISSDDYRVRLSGKAVLEFTELSAFNIPRGALIGIESGGDSIYGFKTNITLQIKDGSRLALGEYDFGGGLQIGNTHDYSVQGGDVQCTITLSGRSAQFTTAKQGFFGMGLGIVSKTWDAPDTWRVAPLYNASAIKLELLNGAMQHNSIYVGSDQNASLWGIGRQTSATGLPVVSVVGLPVPVFSDSLQQVQIRGGANLVLVTGPMPLQVGGGYYINPVVGAVPGVITNNLSVGILGSKPVLTNGSKTASVHVSATPVQIFEFLAADSYQVQSAGQHRAEIFETSLGSWIIGYLSGTTINRPEITTTWGSAGSPVYPSRSLAVGVVLLDLSTSGPNAYAIQS